MDEFAQKNISKSPERTANWFSRLYFLWTLQLFRKGFREELEQEDAWPIPRSSTAEYLGSRLRKALDAQGNKKQSLAAAMLPVFGREFLWVLFLGTLYNCVFKVGQAVSLQYVLLFYEGEFGLVAGVGLTLLLLLISVAYYTVFHQFTLQSQRLGMRIRVSISYLIYQKSLRLSQVSLSKLSVGQVTNLLSNDVSRFDRYMTHLPYLFVAPLQVCLACYFLYPLLGPAIFAGMAYILALAPLQGCVGKLFGRLRRFTASKTDKRVRLMNEIVNGISLIKFLTWEQHFTNRLAAARALEMKSFRWKGRLDAVNRALFETSTKVVVLIALATFVFTGNGLTAATVYTTLTMINGLRSPVTFYLPAAVMAISEINVTLRRIQTFLEEDEQLNGTDAKAVDVGQVITRNFTAGFSINDPPVLESLSINISPGSFVGVVGNVGSGKSSLFYAILEELPALSGELLRGGSVAYASQNPTIFSRSVRENILFGRPMKEQWYARVLDACSLLPDLRLFPSGDLTLVGDRGLILSGGQKMRINLARAIYSKSDVYLLDDPLSAVDAEVGQQIFQNAIRGLLKGRTVVLVTHLVHFLKTADEILILEKGRLLASGNYSQLEAQLMPFLETEPTTLHDLTADELRETENDDSARITNE